MRVNINGEWYDSEVTPIQIELSETDKNNINNILDSASNYAVYPDKLVWSEVKRILKIEK